MRSARQFIASLALLLAAGSAGAQAHAEDAVSYRDAYRAMVQFEKYGGPKNLLVSQLQVLPKERGALAEGLQLLLSGRSTQLSLPLDLLGRTVFPLQKAAYDDNAALSLSRKGLGFVLRPQVSIAVRPDGVYDVLELRAGCAQALGFARYVDASHARASAPACASCSPGRPRAGHACAVPTAASRCWPP